jgi:diguanylate cyclase (GGDEF)-like protein
MMFEKTSLANLRRCLYENIEKLAKKNASLEREENNLQREVEKFEDLISEYFLFYDVTRKIAPFLTKEDLFKNFSEEIRYLGSIEEIKLTGVSKKENCLKFKLIKGEKEYLSVKTESEKVIKYLPYFARLLKLCLERIKLYEKMQELSIYDSLTKVYNRRYFTERYLAEFERAKKINIDLSLLMIDIDHFKKINDNYGHLVGDAVLREVAKLIRDNLREIDFVGRFGGEEFSVILPETDKAGAIMVAERISSRISREYIRVFDETLTATVSIGIAAFATNITDPKAFMEIADKALYKAKVMGRNRVCWF